MQFEFGFIHLRFCSTHDKVHTCPTLEELMQLYNPFNVIVGLKDYTVVTVRRPM